MTTPRLIMYHKHATSARTRFLKLACSGAFLDLSEARELPGTELEWLRRVYEFVPGG